MIRNLIVVEAGAELTLIETHQGGAAAQQVQQVSEIFVGKGAKLTHIRLQDVGKATVHLATDLVDVAEGATYRGFVLTTGAELARQESFVEFSGEDAEAHVSGAYLLSGSQHADVTTRIHHAVPQCVSREVFKGVVADKARGVFQGRIVVAKDAQKTDGHMLNKTLLLSDRAEMDAKPELEIYADDVKCSHGATTGQLDANQLFYLRARGIDEATARGLLMQSFLAEALEEVEDEAIREVLQGRVDAWLGSHAEAWRPAA
jgi:Fe-S cluster assembly protein SufD